MATTLELELEALGRARPALAALGSSLRSLAQAPQMSATADPGADSPSLVAARAVSSQTIPAVQGIIADRFTEVGDLIDMARTKFAESDQTLTTAITAAGSLLPPSR
ncbi:MULTISPECIES: hypothetical protein [Mycobacterium]|uniref:PE family protein n=1 Tax=Mycobacterium kiyosense TaxID=2871094 RepID=A0A9P3UY58_9MYCO|nr:MULTISPECIES: hypothetical protein [Mycobacterium]BDB40902.1 hypothetical protein IWGMT90018_13480 [Mycobacterium kiyosense]BDE12698.1 hypothetical protein MKCMC460_15580 [Mycobacterium sp. 20KCMC460]GLB82639.1 hypothetical protein SRL2020028_18950 [Mycobacterium kiyosense]GLB87855.1 hypothetical protein SRL2020130_06720 [Mycobacterium kiyosense]GLB94012.1 hypothetical protein SRL2020226_07880 [Mycobacterium kiyosense]